MPSLAATISPLLLPSAILIAHSYAATSSLKTWYAVSNLQNAPPPATEEEEQDDKRRLRRKKIVGIVLACAFLMAEFWIVAQGTEKHIAYLLQVLVGSTLFAAHFTALSKLLGAKWVVARRRSGHLSFSLNKPTKWAKAATAGLVLVAGSNCYITLTQPENTPMRLLSIAAIVVSLTSRCTAKKTGVRNMTIFFMTYEAIVIFLTVVLIVPSYKSSSFNDLFVSTPAAEDATISPLAPLVNQLFGILVPAFYTAPVGQYLSLLLRFDHSQSSTTLSSSSPQLSLESVAAPVKGCRRTNGAGLVIPFSTSSTSIVPKSTRTYYSLGLSITSFIYLFIAPLLHKAMQIYVFPALAFTEYAFLEDQIFAMLAMFITMPVLVLVMGVFAKTRGEGKTFWRYEEHWVKEDKKDEGAVQLATDGMQKQPLVFVERDNATFPEDKKMPLEV